MRTGERAGDEVGQTEMAGSTVASTLISADERRGVGEVDLEQLDARPPVKVVDGTGLAARREGLLSGGRS